MMSVTGLGKLKRAAAVLAVAAVAFSAAACGSDDLPDIVEAEEEYGAIAPEEVGPEDVAREDPGAALDGAAPGESPDGAANDGRRVVYLILPTDTGFSAIEKERITEQMKAGGYGVAVRIYDEDMEKQKAAFAEAIYGRAAAIICDNLAGDETRDSVRAAHEASIPTFLMDQGIDLSGVAQGQLVADRSGRTKELAALFAGEGGEPLNYVMLGGSDEDMRSRDMCELISRALNRYVHVTRLAEERQPAYDRAEAEAMISGMLESCPEANALICYNTMQTEAGLAAVAAAGRSGEIRVLCVSGDRDHIMTLIGEGQVEAAIVEPAETLADMVSDDVFRYFRTGSPEWSERRYVLAEILTKEDIPDKDSGQEGGS